MSGWRTVPSNPNFEVSSEGRVRKIDGSECGQWKNQHGYPMVRLSGPRRIERVHRLVAQAFCPNPDGKPFINHIDNDRANNCASNLEWCTQAENLKHMTDQGRRAAPWKGKRSPSARLEDDAVLAIRAEYAAGGTSWDRLAKKWKVSKRVVGRLLNMETYVDV